jgi:hypothetical protein
MRVSPAWLILDLQDQFAINRGFSGVRPRVLGRVRFQLVTQTDPATGASVPLPKPLEMKVIQTPSGLFLFFGNVVTADGLVRRVDPQASPWTIRILSDYYQTLDKAAKAAPDTFNAGTAAAGAPLQQEFVVEAILAPGAAYPFPNEPPGQPGGRLRGALRNPDGSAVAGAQVQAVDANGKLLAGPALTGDDGQWVMVMPTFPANGVVTVQFTYPGGTKRTVTNVPVASDRENNLPQTALRGQVRLRKMGIANAVISVNEIRGEQAVTYSTGNWFYYFAPDSAGGPFTVTAALPDQSATKSLATVVIPRATVVVPTFDF